MNSGVFRKSRSHPYAPVRCSSSNTQLNIPYSLSDAPARLKKELDSVLTLQGDLDSINRTIQSARTTLAKTMPSHDSISQLSSLERTHERLMAKVEGLYASLNVHESFPELNGIDFNFVQTLLMARDLKINIRKRAIGSFFEWDKLDQAAGGREEALGRL